MITCLAVCLDGQYPILSNPLFFRNRPDYEAFPKCHLSGEQAVFQELGVDTEQLHPVLKRRIQNESRRRVPVRPVQGVHDAIGTRAPAGGEPTGAAGARRTP